MNPIAKFTLTLLMLACLGLADAPLYAGGRDDFRFPPPDPVDPDTPAPTEEEPRTPEPTLPEDAIARDIGQLLHARTHRIDFGGQLRLGTFGR